MMVIAVDAVVAVSSMSNFQNDPSHAVDEVNDAAVVLLQRQDLAGVVAAEVVLEAKKNQR